MERLLQQLNSERDANVFYRKRVKGRCRRNGRRLQGLLRSIGLWHGFLYLNDAESLPDFANVMPRGWPNGFPDLRVSYSARIGLGAEPRGPS